ncbi:MAG: hypothetical protein JNM66_08360 [Bryobacterales bacterium]|nr:hypothetical protein [Bryobacterales bacterium]
MVNADTLHRIRVYSAEAEWVAHSAIHVGSGESSSAAAPDSLLVRRHNGHFFVPAASWIGAARAALALSQLGSATFSMGLAEEPEPLRLLFGGGEKEGLKQSFASLLTAADAPALNDPLPALRDGVRIDAKSGLAFSDKDGGAKFQLEVLPAGTRFRLRFALNIPAVIPLGLTEDQLCSQFRALLEGFSSAGISIGARTRRGYGRGSVANWAIQRFDLQTPAGFVAWLKRAHGDPLPLQKLGTLPSMDKNQGLEITISLRLITSLLVRSGGGAPAEPDAVHLTENGTPVLPGTSIAGALRSRCRRIALSLLPEAHADELIVAMFGPLKKEGERTALRASRVWVHEAQVHDVYHAVHTRVSIDRFTQGALDTRLFDEAPLWPKRTVDGHLRDLRIRLMPLPCQDERASALLLLAVKDLWLGDLALGGGAAVGRGVWNGIRATVSHPQLGTILMSNPNPSSPSDVRIEGAGLATLNRWCEQWTQ